MSPYWLNEADKDAARFGVLHKDVFQHWQDVVHAHGDQPGTPYGEANQRLITLKQQQKWGSLNLLLHDDNSLENWADYQASWCVRRWNVRGKIDPEQLQDHQRFAAYLGIEVRQMLALMPDQPEFWALVLSHLQEFPIKPVDIVPAKVFDTWIDEMRWKISVVRRLCNRRWWLRRAKTQRARVIEEMKRTFGHVHASRDIYLSALSFESWKVRQADNMNTLRDTEIENDLGQRFTLAELFYGSPSNPVIRRIELMTRIAGTEKLAKALDYHGSFITITAPSAFHAYSYRKSKQGKQYAFKNKRYQGFTVRDAQQYLCERWAIIRAELHQQGIDYFGIRVVEPHHDGCPHWHLLLFAQESDLAVIEQVITDKSLAQYGDEPSAAKRRVKVERIKQGINPNTGREYSAVGYIAKYISKSIDGKGIEQDQYQQDATRSAQKIRAWASVHGIRQFQFYGGLSATLWREMRRFGAQFRTFNPVTEVMEFDERAAFMYMRDQRPELVHLISALYDMETEQDASEAYCQLALKVRDQQLQFKTLTTAHGHEYVHQQTGEVHRFDRWLDLNQYGENAPSIKGLWFFSSKTDRMESVITRPYEWTLVSGHKSRLDEPIWH